MRLLQGDCLDLMKNIEEESIDCVVVDPPYRLNKTTGSMTSTSKSEKWQGLIKAGDKRAGIINDTPFSKWLSLVYNIMKSQSHIYIFVNDKNLADLMNEMSKVGFRIHNVLVWKKNNATPNRWYMKNGEFIVFGRKGKAKPINNLGSKSIIEINNIRNKIHPTQKPIKLLQILITNSTDKGDVVFDCFMGSGSTGIACIETNRSFIGIEKDETYFNLAKKRINDHMWGNDISLNN